MSGFKRASRRTSKGTVVINRGVAIVGSLTLEGEVFIEGTVDGEVWCTGAQIAERGAVEGLMVAKQVVVLGEFRGEIYAEELVLGAGCVVEGYIYHNKLSVEAGCYFEGKSRRDPDPLRLAPVAEAAQSREEELPRRVA